MGERCLLDVVQSVPVVFKPQNLANLLYQIEVLIIFLQARVQGFLASLPLQSLKVAPNQLQELSKTVQVNETRSMLRLNHGCRAAEVLWLGSILL